MQNMTANISEDEAPARVIKTDAAYRAALTEVERLVVADPAPDSIEGERLELLTLLIQHYESQRFSFEAPDPIEAIEFRMEEQGLKQRDLVSFIGSRSRVSEVLSRKRPLTVQMIRALASGLGIPLEALVNVPNVSAGTRLEPVSNLDWRKVPWREMGKRGWFDDLKEKIGGSTEDIVAAFFRAATDAKPLYRRRLRGQELDERAYYSTLAWSARVLLRARAQEKTLGSFSRATLTKDTFHDLARLSWLDNGPKLAEQFLSKMGIAVVVESRLPDSVLDGAALLTESRVPVIALTLRIDRLDYFWFTLMHELAHIWLHLDRPDELFIDRLEGAESSEQTERDADRVAKEAFVPLNVWKRSAAFLNPTREAIQELGDQLHISPAIIAGRVQFETGKYELFRELLGQGKVRRLFPEAGNKEGD
jgi:HTH-type transcriptional regulator/antitoxin HigA